MTMRTIGRAAVICGICFASAACTAAKTTPNGVPPSTGPALATSGAPPASASERPIPAESSPPGDIPDNQAFVAYHAAGGFDVEVPEGWARTTTTSGATFTDKLNAIAASWRTTSEPPSEQRARSKDVPELQRTQHAFELRDISTVKLPGGTAVLIEYRANSAPNDVTGKRYRLDVLLYEFFRAGTEADLSLSSPVGADNVDPWNKVSRSFAWR